MEAIYEIEVCRNSEGDRGFRIRKNGEYIEIPSAHYPISGFKNYDHLQFAKDKKFCECYSQYGIRKIAKKYLKQIDPEYDEWANFKAFFKWPLKKEKNEI